jgi:hypothetical protein
MRLEGRYLARQLCRPSVPPQDASEENDEIFDGMNQSFFPSSPTSAVPRPSVSSLAKNGWRRLLCRRHCAFPTPMRLPDQCLDCHAGRYFLPALSRDPSTAFVAVRDPVTSGSRVNPRPRHHSRKTKQCQQAGGPQLLVRCISITFLVCGHPAGGRSRIGSSPTQSYQTLACLGV